MFPCHFSLLQRQHLLSVVDLAGSQQGKPGIQELGEIPTTSVNASLDQHAFPADGFIRGWEP